MTVTITIYDPQGEAFDHTPPNARDLVNNAGWSFTPPANHVTDTVDDDVVDDVDEDDDVVIEPETPPTEPEKPPTEPVTPPPTESTGPVTPPAEGSTVDPTEGLSELLEPMSRSEVDAYALKQFGVKLNGRLSKETLVAQVFKLARGETL